MIGGDIHFAGHSLFAPIVFRSEKNEQIEQEIDVGKTLIAPVLVCRTNTTSVGTIVRPDFNEMIVTFQTWDQFRDGLCFDLRAHIGPAKNNEKPAHFSLLILTRARASLTLLTR